MDIQEQFYDYIEKNDINNVKLLLNDKRVNPSDRNNWAIILASKDGYFDIVKLLLEDKRVDPSDHSNYFTKENSYNWAIYLAFSNGYFNISNLLWQDQRVKNTLKKDIPDLYNQLVKQDTKEKVDKF